MENLYRVSKKRLGADCGSDHELFISKFQLKLKNVGKTTRLFRYDLILYIENPKDSTRKLLELINDYSKVAGYKINTRNPLHSYTLIMRKQKEKLRKQFHLPLQ